MFPQNIISVVLFFLGNIYLSKPVFGYTFNLINDSETSDQRQTQCVPKVWLINCGVSIESAPNISRSTDLVILRSVITTQPSGSVCPDYETFNSYWKVWRILRNHDELKDTPSLKMSNTKAYVPNEETMDFGVYKVQLTVVFTLLEYPVTEKAYCYFRVIRTQIQTTILGGSMRNMYYKQPLTFHFYSSTVPDRYNLDKDMKLVYDWRCDDLQEQFCQRFQTSDTTRKIEGPFQVPKTYMFTVNTKATQKLDIVMQHPETQVINFVSTDLNLAINCLKNCGGSVFKSNPQEVILLEVTSTLSLKKVTLHWKYKCLEDKTDFQEVDAIKDPHSTEYKLLVMRNKLKTGKNYVFLVAAVNSQSSVETRIQTDESPDKAVCEIFPNSGTKGETRFRVSCVNRLGEDGFPSLSYEFYDRYQHEPIGRMVGYSTTGLIADIILTRDTFVVRTTNYLGTATENTVKVKLMSPVKDFSPSMIESERELKNKDYIYRIGLISAYSDLSHSLFIKTEVIPILLDRLTSAEVQPQDIIGDLLLQNSLNITACDKLIDIVYDINMFNCETLLSIAKIMHQVTSRLQMRLIRNQTNWRILTTARTKLFVDSVLECSNLILEANFLSKHKPSDMNVHECFKNSIYYTIDTLDDLVYIVSLELLLIKKQKFISKNIVLYVDEMRPYIEDSVLKTTLDLTKIQKQVGFNYYMQQIIFNRNSYWWGSGIRINTNVYNFQINKGNEHIQYPAVGRVFHFHLTVNQFKPLLFQGSVEQPDPENKPQVNDFEVVVYRIDPEKYSETFIEFISFRNNTELKVLILYGERPDFDLMTTKATKVTWLSRKRSLDLKGKKQGNFYYMGILPGPQVKIGSSVDYSFTVYSARCAVLKYKSWMSGKKCAVDKRSNINKLLLVCSCTVLTLSIAGYVYNPIVTINPFSDVSLFLKIPENTLTVSLLLTIFLLFLIILIWTRKKDNEDTKRINISVLQDNRINDPYMYLIAVFTGARFGAGTTSNVGIKLVGETATSRTRVFSASHNQLILKCGADDWFLLSTHQHLGSLHQIKLWIDYSGRFPNWFCRKVIVCDLKNSKTYTFIVEQWFGINLSGVCVEVVTKSAASDEVNTFRLIFFHNLIRGLREFHIYLSIFFKHPRSLITRTQRLSVALCCVLTAMSMTTLLYSLSTPVFEDYAVFEITTKTFVISFISSLSAIVVNVTIMHYFRKSCIIVGNKFSTPSDIEFNDKNINKSDPKNKSFCFKLLYNYTEKYVSSCKMIPIDNTVSVKEKKSERNLAWMICSAVMFVSVYIIIMSSLTYGEVKRSLWFTSLTFSTLGVFILIPIKVLLTALFLSLLNIRYFDPMSHNITENKFLMSVTREKHTRVNKEEYEIVRADFFHSYVSWHNHRYDRVDKAQYKTVRIWISAYILEAVILIGVIVWVMGEFDTYKGFYANTAICNEMLSVKMCDNILDVDTGFTSLRFNVLAYMLPKLYRTKWYNGHYISFIKEIYQSTGWMHDANSRLIGEPHLLQVRVQRNVCQVPKMMFNITKTCLPSLSSSTVDRDNYGPSWTHDDWTEIELFSESPWEFVQGSGIGVRTPSDYYLREGAYVASLLRNLDAAQLVYTNLIDTNWVDEQTRVIVLEFVTYNVNNNLITSSYFVTETYPTKHVRYSYTIRSKIPYYHHMSFQSKLFIFFSLYFVIRTLVLVNIMGVGNFLKSFWNCYDVFFSILYIAATVKYYYLLYLFGTDEAKAEARVQNRHVYLEVIFQATQETILYICYTFGVAAMRLIRIAHINDSCKSYMSDIIETRTELVLTLLLSFSSIFIMFRLVMYYLELPYVYDFMDILVLLSDFSSLREQNYHFIGMLSAYILSCFSNITMFSFTISLLHHHRLITLRRISLIEAP